jgi:hypothetical protein
MGQSTARILPEQRERILADLRAGMSYADAAVAHGVSHRAVRRLSQEAGLPNRCRMQLPEPGTRFGRLTVLSSSRESGKPTATCICDCGSTKTVVAYFLYRKTGPTRSCGCLQREASRDLLRGQPPEVRARAAARAAATRAAINRTPEARARAGAANVTHGMGKHPLYHTWRGMMSRCYNPAATGYQHYGGRVPPVTVCEPWHDVRTYIAYVEEHVGARPPGIVGKKRKRPKYTMDRIDNDRGYEPGNLRWADGLMQSHNSRRWTQGAAA